MDALLDFLEKSRFLSCERFSESLVRRRLDSYGNHRIMAELQTHQLDPALLAHSKAELAQTEVARACAVWQRKFGRSKAPVSSGYTDDVEPEDKSGTIPREERARQIRYLAQRGFSSSAITAAMRGVTQELDELDGLDESL